MRAQSRARRQGARRGDAAGRTAASFPAADEDYFHDMDGGRPLHPRADRRAATCGSSGPAATIGSGTCCGRELRLARFAEDHLVASRRCRYSAATARWNYLGLVNEPCFKKATGPDPNRFGLWLDVRDPACPPDPFADADKYPGVRIGARGKTVPVGSYYGEPTGIVGLRLFPNPDFDEKAREEVGLRSATTAIRAYYYSTRSRAAVPRRHVVRVLPRRAEPDQAAGRSREPRVGEPQLERRRAVLLVGPRLQLAAATTNAQSFFYQALHTSRPGTLDTSLVSTDNINNPRTMNAVYYLRPRMVEAQALGQGDARRRRAEQQAVQRLRAAGRSAGAVLRSAGHDVDAARAEGRLRFGRRARRAEPRLPQHRPVQRGVAAALPAAGRRHADHADPDRRRREELGRTGRRPRRRRRTWRGSSWPARTRIT